MSWLDEGLKYLQDAFAPVVQEDSAGRKFSNKPFTEIKAKLDPLPGLIEVQTLTGLRDLINNNTEAINLGEGKPMIHIRNHAEVALLRGLSDTEGRRLVVARATPPKFDGFKFDEYHDITDFIIGVHAKFAHTIDRDYLISISSKITAEGVTIAEDDGISQQVTVNASLALKGTEKLKSRVTLCPFRTFTEAEQPASEFILRAQKDEDGVTLALFEADGGRWKNKAIENIAWTLRDLGVTLPIIA